MANLHMGKYERSVNGKGRICLPQPLLKALQVSGSDEVVLIKGKEKCIYLYDSDAWQGIIKKAKNQLSYAECQLLMRYVLPPKVSMSKIDSQGRVLIPANLRQYAAIAGRVMIISALDRIEIWNLEEWLAHLNTLEDVVNQQFSNPSLRKVTRYQQAT
ncbi:MAG: hypothetical protein ISS53_04565 [Dehalococcoidia bacterium]|nr:hypothetical protein [Dehalococcoidia bacterium]